jgi:hypothetical protein
MINIFGDNKLVKSLELIFPYNVDAGALLIRQLLKKEFYSSLTFHLNS